MPDQLQALDSRAAPPQQAEPEPARAGCEDLGANPGQGKEYDLVKNLFASQRGCAPPPAVIYQKTDAHAATAPDGRSASQQEELDRAACRSEGEAAANANLALRPGEYDLVKNIIGAQRGTAEQAEKSCMNQRGYTPEAPARKGLFN
jgi:hypothetical protein